MKNSYSETQTKQKQSSGFFSLMGDFIKPYSGKYALSIIISCLGVLCNLGSYATAGLIAGKIWDGSRDFNEYIILLVVLVCFKLLYGIGINTSTWISHRAAFRTLQDIRLALTDKMMQLPLGYFETNGSGRLKTLIVDRVESIEKTLAHLLPEMSANILIPLAMIIWACFIDWRVGLIITIWIVTGLTLSSGMMKGYEEKFSAFTKAEKNMNQAIVEYVDGIEVIKNFNRTKDCFEKLETNVKGHASYAFKWQKETEVFMAMVQSVAPFSVLPVTISGFIFVSNGSLQVPSMLLLILLSLGIYGPLYRAISYTDQVASMGTVAREVREVLDMEELKRGEVTVIDSNPKIVFDKVSFSYGEGEKEAVNKVSFCVKPRTMFALVGPSGSGKSTIAKLLAGYWDKSSGDILIGDKSIHEWSQQALNNMIAYVDQETFLFPMSIMDNIRMGNPNATDDQIMEAAKQAGCYDFIQALPEGFHTNAGVAGNRLSGGEKQRIAIVRAMLKNAPIMVLDEATASADPENEAEIQKAISALAQNKTVIIVAHKLSTIVGAEQIALVKDGEIVTIGTHEKMLEDCQEYASMWERFAGSKKGEIV